MKIKFQHIPENWKPIKASKVTAFNSRISHKMKAVTLRWKKQQAESLKKARDIIVK